MRIRVYIPFVDDKPAGLLRFCGQLSRSLRIVGADVELLIGQLLANPDWADQGTTKVLFPTWFQRHALSRLLLVPFRLMWLQFGYPLVVANYRTTPLLLLAHESAPFPWWPQTAVVHDLTALHVASGRNTLLHRVLHRLWVSGLRRSSHIVAISEATRTDLLKRHPELTAQTVVISEGVDRDVFTNREFHCDGDLLPACAGASDYLLYAGTLAQHKNLPFLVKILADLIAQGRQLRLALVGKHDALAKESLQSVISEEGVARSVDFLGYVSDETLAALMRRCACFTFPSLNEGFGLAVAEAMACGAPVVCSSAGSLPEVVRDGGVLLPPHDRAAWTHAISVVLDDTAFRLDLKRRGVERATQLTWDAVAKCYSSLLAPA